MEDQTGNGALFVAIIVRSAASRPSVAMVATATRRLLQVVVVLVLAAVSIMVMMVGITPMIASVKPFKLECCGESHVVREAVGGRLVEPLHEPTPIDRGE